MVTKYKYFMLFILLTSCVNYYYIKKDKNGEPNINENEYSINKSMDKQNFQVIDTTSLYLELLENLASNDNPNIIRFHNDGSFELKSKKYFNKFSNVRTKKSIYYGGRFCLDGNKLKIEGFYPATGGNSDQYVREISTGIIKNDTVKLMIFNIEHVYIKKTYNEIFKP